LFHRYLGNTFGVVAGKRVFLCAGALLARHP